ncbi:MAG: hypothetical protein M0R06_26855 [Sphaerochaeta sp.]|jgi:hypothetical protein|nr:hypothetical protein [Sphaerochaeta sp.]
MAKRKSYDDEFRASAVIMLEAQGYPGIDGALTAVANHLGVPARTLSRWFNRESNPPPDNIVNEKKGELVGRLDGLLDELVEEMRTALKGASLNQLAMAFGITFDKKQLLNNGPTSRNELSGTVTVDVSGLSTGQLEALAATLKD